MSVRRYDTIAVGLLKKEEEEELEIRRMPNRDFFTSHGVYVNLRYIAMYTLIRLEISRRTRWWCLKCVMVYLARDIPAFVMYCVNGESGSPRVYRLYDIYIYFLIYFLYIFNIFLHI